MAELALQDGLTGLANRRALEERLGMALEEAAEDDEVTLLLCDVDNLKELNDVRGHHGGDWALKAVAGTLRTAAEALPRTLVCRLSGDEFGILAEGSSLEADAARGGGRDRPPGRPPPARRACPAASPPAASSVQRPSELLRAADAALYTAKRTGRGRVCLADIDPQTAWRSTGRPGARRARRDGLDVDTGALLAQGARRCSTATCAPPRRSSASRGSRPRSAPALRASAAAVSLCPHGAGVIETLFTLDLRSGHSSSVRFGVDGERYELGVYPRTADLLANGGSLHLYAGDAEADAAERALLDELGDDGRARPRRPPTAAAPGCSRSTATPSRPTSASPTPRCGCSPPTRCARRAGCAPSAAPACARCRSRSRRAGAALNCALRGSPEAAFAGVWSLG